jgi:hypothetical protein
MPCAAVIRFTSGGATDNKTISKWVRALRYVACCNVRPSELKTFMKEAGGVNACAVGTLNILEGLPDKKCWVGGRPFGPSRQCEMSEYQSRAEHVHLVEVQLSIQGSLYTFSFLETMTFASNNRQPAGISICLVLLKYHRQFRPNLERGSKSEGKGSKHDSLCHVVSLRVSSPAHRCSSASTFLQGL